MRAIDVRSGADYTTLLNGEEDARTLIWSLAGERQYD
jgi:hypothetical protein